MEPPECDADRGESDTLCGRLTVAAEEVADGSDEDWTDATVANPLEAAEHEGDAEIGGERQRQPREAQQGEASRKNRPPAVAVRERAHKRDNDDGWGGVGRHEQRNSGNVDTVRPRE